MALERTVFLDRDGVINVDSPAYIKSWKEFAFLPGSLEAMVELTRSGHQLILITNQSIIGRGMVPLSALQDIHLRLQRAVEAAGGRIVDIFYCPHHPDDCCDCRKPAPGMILAAGRRHHVNLSSAVMIGDTDKDIHCGRNAGCGATILVRTGNGRAAERALRSQGVDTIVADDLSHAARMLVSERHRVFSDR